MNVIPLEGGNVLISKPRDFGGLIIKTLEREFIFKFNTTNELVMWYHKLQGVVSKEIKVKNYLKRVKE